MKPMTVTDVQKLLKRFGTFIYTGDPLGDYELWQDELLELYKMKLIDDEEFSGAIAAIRKRISELESSQEKR